MAMDIQVLSIVHRLVTNLCNISSLYSSFLYLLIIQIQCSCLPQMKSSVHDFEEILLFIFFSFGENGGELYIQLEQ